MVISWAERTKALIILKYKIEPVLDRVTKQADKYLFKEVIKHLVKEYNIGKPFSEVDYIDPIIKKGQLSSAY